MREAEERLCERPCTLKKKCQKKLIFTNLKKRLEHIELPAKLLDYFLRSHKSNINQSGVLVCSDTYGCEELEVGFEPIDEWR